jgi:hypothetical protein
MSEMAERIEEAAQLARRYRGTVYETASIAYLRAQIEQARQTNERPTTAGKGRP